MASEPHPSGFSPLVSLCFTVNYVMGTGFLTLPEAFNSAGLLLALVILLCLGWVSDVSKDFVLESMARAETITVEEEKGKPFLSAAASSDEEGDVKDTLLSKVSSSWQTADKNVLPCVAERKFEIIEMSRLFLGPRGATVYVTTFGFYMYGCLWAYTAVFANAMASTVPIQGMGEDGSYLVYVAIFASITVPMTCMELREQVTVQILLSLCRLLMVIVMVTTVSFSMHSTSPQFDNQTSHYTPINLFSPSGIYKILPIATYANIFHHSIPGLSMPVGDKTKLSLIFRAVFIVMAVGYGLIGMTVAAYFGENIQGSSNLNWHDYRAGTGTCTENCDDDNDNDKVWDGRSWWVNVIVWFVVLFPALDVASAFPLNGITLGNCLMGKYYGEDIRKHEGDRRKVTVFRILAAVPPIIGATAVRQLDTITEYTGLTGYIICFVFPGLLHINSEKECKRRGVEERTIYGGFLTRTKGMPIAVAVFGGFLLVYTLANLFGE